MTEVQVRCFQPGDEMALHAIFHSAIHETARRDYSQEQVDAWSPQDFDMREWAAKMRALDPFVAEIGAHCVGYADLQEDGLIDHFFVSGYHQRLGVGRALMARVMSEARRLGLLELRAHVSLSAQPFFESFGFTIVERRQPVLRGVAFENALMRHGLENK